MAIAALYAYPMAGMTLPSVHLTNSRVPRSRDGRSQPDLGSRPAMGLVAKATSTDRDPRQGSLRDRGPPLLAPKVVP